MSLADDIQKIQDDMTKVQARLDALRQERNEAIMKLLDEGWNPYRISLLLGLSPVAVGKIVKAMEKATQPTSP